MRISSQFDAGNIEVISTEAVNDIQLKIRKDNQSDFLQWFYFRLHGAKNQACTLKILNASACSYPQGWQNYNIVASYDKEHWFRIPSHYDGNALTIKHTPEANSIYYAYFTPYSYERHQELIGHAQQHNQCEVSLLGQTVDGRDLDLLTLGQLDQSNSDHHHKKKIWLIARQHPGETMAEWFIEGFLGALLDENNALARVLLSKAVFYVVPNMNPDGSVRGNLRTNAAGANLNREWQTPSIINSPEVYYVKEKMQETGVDLFLDIHGDEALPYNFVAGTEGNPSYSARIQRLEEQFKDAFKQANPDFQDQYGYDKDQPGQANLTVACNNIGQTFDCLAFTIEMPFKDNADLPCKEFGWSAERSEQLGASVLQPIYNVIDQLR
ncbi:Zinc carboxypeptidase [Piscirickettsia salmonis]|uniref:M14 family metallopeptidase n=1 Tax=Piscirickettsia salmonis TaxID=1238 RepID=UPI0012B8D845|nr:M14-type cytosolic carboxypeptidase [Piscirickettsia salmonis]QGP50338.1 Zinc carboxypeptidase [Piscirickettsia salmonis]